MHSFNCYLNYYIRNKEISVLEAIIITTVLLSDQLLKQWIRQTIPLHTVKQAIPAVFNWYHIQNQGAGWGLFEGQLFLFYSVSIGVLGYLGYELWKQSSSHWLWRSSLALLIAGTLGNLVDRLIFGYVTDMIELTFISFPIFNVADMALTFGIIGMILYIFKSEMRD